MVVRALRRERDEHGTPWERCAIVARSVGGYASLLESVCDRYGVPVRFVQGRPLLENPLVRSIDHLLAVWADRWRRDDVIALLKGGFAPVPVEHADRLRIQARKRALREGRDAWERLLGDPAEKQGSWGAFIAALSETDTVLHAGRLSVEEVRAALTGFLERVGWSAEKQREDAGALKKALSILDDLAEHDRQRGAPPAAFAELRQRLRRAWQSASWAPRPEPGCVTVLEPYDLGQARASWVAVIGLTERVFPRRPGEDPFLRDDERALLREQGLDLEIRGERGDDERLLFYLAVTAPSDRLLLSFPRASDESDTLPSFYLDEVRAALPHLPSVVRTLADVAPHPDECVDDRDRLLSACADAADTPGPPERPEVHGLAAVQSTRDLPPVPALGAEALGAYAAPHRLSVSEVESYNRCPFQHLMQYGLRLRAEEDGARDRDKGILLHAALRRTLRRQKEEDRRPDAAALMEELCQDLGACLDGYPVDAPAHRRAMMEQAVTDALAGFSEREALLREQFGLAAAHFELAFGMEAETPDEEGRSREYDAASSPVPLRLEVEEGRAVELCGAIDRVDLMEDGKRAIVVDYKIGKGAEWPAVKAGESIQMPLYLMAVEQVFGMTPVAACYDSARDGGRRRFIRRDQLAAAEQRVFGPAPGEDGRMVKPVGPDEYTEAADNAVDAVRRAVLGIASGRVLPRPGDHCRWCDYGDICRAQSGTHDGAPLPVEEPPM
jgi:ATP-dependent helicase/nuclease subunit B